MLRVIQINKHSRLIERSLRNDRKAQKLLYEEFSPKMLSLCAYYINDRQHAEEVMLNGFLKVFTKLSQYANKGSFEGWIRKIMVHECISYHRQRKQLVFTDGIESFQPLVQNDVEMTVAVEDLHLHINQLPEACRIVFNMYVIEGFKHAEISEILNISEGTSKAQVHRARKALKEMISSHQKKYYERR